MYLIPSYPADLYSSSKMLSKCNTRVMVMQAAISIAEDNWILVEQSTVCRLLVVFAGWSEWLRCVKSLCV